MDPEPQLYPMGPALSRALHTVHCAGIKLYRKTPMARKIVVQAKKSNNWYRELWLKKKLDYYMSIFYRMQKNKSYIIYYQTQNQTNHKP